MHSCAYLVIKHSSVGHHVLLGIIRMTGLPYHTGGFRETQHDGVIVVYFATWVHDSAHTNFSVHRDLNNLPGHFHQFDALPAGGSYKPITSYEVNIPHLKGRLSHSKRQYRHVSCSYNGAA